MANKYDKKLILDYVSGNDIEDYDIDELENDYEFMMEVISYTKDKNMYALCSDSVKNNYMFIRFLVETFHDDFDFIAELANEYLKDIDHDDITYKELTVLVSQYADKNNTGYNFYKFKLNKEMISKCMLIDVEQFLSKQDDQTKRELGLGFILVTSVCGTSKILMDFFAKEFIDNIFYDDDKYTLEELIHLNTKNREDLNTKNLNNYIHNYIGTLDQALAHYVVNNLSLIESLKKDLTYIYNKWDYYMNNLKLRREDIVNAEISEFMQQYKFNIDFDVYELINYILVNMGYEPIEDECTVYNKDSQIAIIQKLKNGQELTFIEQKIVNYVTNLISNLYHKDVIDEDLTDYDDYGNDDAQVINVNFGAKK